MSRRALVSQMVSDGIICGASLALVEYDRASLFYYGKQGVVEPYKENPIKEGLYYDLASLSKVIGTTTRILQLVDEGRICLDTKVGQLLPRFLDETITVKHLLLHSSGLPGEIPHKKSWAKETLLDQLYATQPKRAVGKEFCYSDVGFILLGKLIELLDHMSLEESYESHIFQPLGMKQTTFFPPKNPIKSVPTECTLERGCICGQVHDRKCWLLGPCGSAGLFSTLEDVSIFVTHYINQSELLFSQELFGRLQEEHFGRTYGWSKEYGGDTLYHTGFTGTSILMDIKERRGMILLSNRIHPVRENPKFIKARECLNREMIGNH